MDHPRKGRRRGKKRRGSADGLLGLLGGEDGEVEARSGEEAAIAAAAAAASTSAASWPLLPSSLAAVSGATAEAEAPLVLRPMALKEVAPTPGGLAPLLSALELLAPLPALLQGLQKSTGHAAVAGAHGGQKLAPLPPAAARQAHRPPLADSDVALTTGPPTAGPRPTLEYTEGTIVVSVGQWKNILPLVSGSTGQSWRFSVRPPLPRGLALNPMNGVISGIAYDATPPEGEFHTVIAKEATVEYGTEEGLVVAATATVYILVLEGGLTETSSYTGDKASPWTSSEE
jgi:hypothetical protein